MKFLDFILTSTTALIISIIILYFLALFIVHIRGFLQPKFFRANQPDKSKPFLNYWSILIKDITNIRLHGYVLQYFNPFLKNQFPSIKIPKIDRRIHVLEFFFIYLVPFVICGVLFVFVRMDVSNHLLSDPLNTPYAQIQIFLANLKNNQIFQFLIKFKKYLIIAVVIFTVLIPSLFLYRKKIKVYQKRFNQGLIIVSILTSISFYSKYAETKYSQVEGELSELAFKLDELHKDIYFLVEEGIILTQENEIVNEKYKQYEPLIEGLENNKLADVAMIRNQEFQQKLKKELKQYVDSLRANTLRLVLPKVPKEVNELRIENFEKLRNSYTSVDSKNVSPDTDYLFNKNQWTKNIGENLKNSVIKKNEKIKSGNTWTKESSKGRYLFAEAYSFLTSLGAEYIADFIPETSNDIIATSFKGISKYFKTDALNLFDEFFKNTLTSKEIPKRSLKNKSKQMSDGYNFLVSKYRKQEREIDFKRKIYEREVHIRNDIENAIFNKLLSELEASKFIEGNFYDNKGNLEGISILDFESRKQELLKRFRNNKQDIISGYEERIREIYDKATKYNNPSDLKAYRNHLLNISGTAIALESNFFNFTPDMRYIHWCCLLDTRVVQFCPNPLCK